MSVTPEFIVIDDDPFNNKICKIILTRTFGEINIKTFTVPEEAIIYLEKDLQLSENTSILMLLDINMPTMTGWEFLAEYEKLDDEIKRSINIYILSSSVDERDKERAVNSPYVIDYLVKPLNAETIAKIVKK